MVFDSSDTATADENRLRGFETVKEINQCTLYLAYTTVYTTHRS